MLQLSKLGLKPPFQIFKKSFSISSILKPNDFLGPRHIGPSEQDQQVMLDLLKCQNLDELIQKVIPAHLLDSEPLVQDGKTLSSPMTESEYIQYLKKVMS